MYVNNVQQQTNKIPNTYDIALDAEAYIATDHNIETIAVKTTIGNNNICVMCHTYIVEYVTHIRVY